VTTASGPAALAGRPGAEGDRVDRREHAEALRPALRSALLIAGLFVVGTVGYKVIGGAGASWLDALYMTTITLTTVGYGEVVDLEGSPGGRLFTIALLLTGVGTFVYFVSNVTAFLVEGTLDRIFSRRRMSRMIDQLRAHYLVCGGGNTGLHVIHELLATRRPFVLVERDPGRIGELQRSLGEEFPALAGDATDDATLVAAGIGRAQGLITCLGEDKDNLVVAFSARALRPALRIVARCLNDADEEKLRRAGADAVVSPNRIGGLRLVSEMVRPAAVSFLDTMLRGRDAALRVEEVTIAPGSALAGSSVAALARRAIPGLLLLALRRGDGTWHYHPDDAARLAAGMGLIFIADPAARAAVEALAAAAPGGGR
jgi:voltage-gated potassium channel